MSLNCNMPPNASCWCQCEVSIANACLVFNLDANIPIITHFKPVFLHLSQNILLFIHQILFSLTQIHTKLKLYQSSLRITWIINVEISKIQNRCCDLAKKCHHYIMWPILVGIPVMHVHHMTIFDRKKKTINSTISTETTIVSFNYPYYHSQTVLAKHKNGHCSPKSG